MSAKNIFRGVLILSLVGLGVVGIRACEYMNQAGKVVEQQVAPGVLLQRYNDFKDTLASLDAIMADIKAQQSNLEATVAAQVDADGKPLPQSQWPQDVRFDYSQSRKELLGKIQAYNKLASDYNAAMAKWQYNFTNVGSLPKGADKPLPREVRKYVYTIH
jgi:hypothetical protein